MNLRVPRVSVNSKRQRKPKAGKPKDKPAQRKPQRSRREAEGSSEAKETTTTEEEVKEAVESGNKHT